ncbi:mannose/fructose/sorbose PTS transporter subunit IIB [Haloimpatiens lingqiaonensis]|uniref:mannose/fructose/sorbose PTS transporter subunit IIB n=1 Tax=Haloimpatiens lingqiaonensis TaxID=1380675 RepID=UPI0010FCE33B|nr:mannose/fructose/sorbose PTS transporter subunit IIB [Haloimpatiens lingqiaonensis]
MNIVLARIDDRLIHGQVATIWTKETKCSRIIVCNDDVAQDEIRKTLLTQVAPPGIKAHVVDLAKAVRVYNNPKYENDRVMFLFTNPSDVLTLVENGVDIKSVNIGGMSFKEGKKKITGAVSVNDEDVDAFKKLNERGIELEIRKVATDSKADIMPLIEKL